jgi:hypothetical protein
MYIQGGSNMTGTNCHLFTHKSSRSYLNHLVYRLSPNLYFVFDCDFCEVFMAFQVTRILYVLYFL